MATVTETDLQQVKELIISLHGEIQKQMTDGNAVTQKQIAELALNTQEQIAGVKGEIKLTIAQLFSWLED
jgi:hypothetical protein